MNKTDENEKFVDLDDDNAIDMTHPEKLASDHITYVHDDPATSNYKHNSPLENIMTLFIYVMFLITIAWSAYMWKCPKLTYDLFYQTGKSVLIFMSAVCIVDSLILFIKYDKPRVLIFSVLLPILYPFKRNKIRNETKTLTLIWFILFIVLFYFSFKRAYPMFPAKYKL